MCYRVIHYSGELPAETYRRAQLSAENPRCARILKLHMTLHLCDFDVNQDYHSSSFEIVHLLHVRLFANRDGSEKN